MFVRALAVLCTIPIWELLPAWSAAADGLVAVAQANTMPAGTPQGDGSAASPAKAKSAERLSQTLPNPSTAFQLSGVIVGPDIKYVILKHTSTNKKKTVRLGEEIDGWTVEDIASDHVVLRHENERIQVELSTRSGVANSVSNTRSNRLAQPAQPPPVTASPSYSRAPTRPASLARQQQRAALRAQLAAERNAKRIQQQNRLAACRLQAQKQGLKRQSRNAFIRSCSGR
jgi:hypothetical protein